MTVTYFRRRQHAMSKKVSAFSLAFVASLSLADPAPLPSQSAELPVASTTSDTRIGSAGDASLQRQPAAMADSTGTDAVAEAENLHRFNELRSELLDHRAKTVDWWLGATAIFLTLFGIVAVIAGYLSFKRFREIETEARGNVESSRKHAEESRNLVDEIKKKRDEVESHTNWITAQAVHNNPDEAHKAAKSVQEDPTASAIDQAVAVAVLLQRQGKIEESMERWHAIAIISEGIDKDLAAQAWFSVGYLIQEYKEDALETAIDAYDEAIRLKPDNTEAYSNRGVAKNMLGRHEAAIVDFDEAIRLKPEYTNAYNSRGVAKNDLGRHEEAIADYNEAIHLKPDYSEAYNNRGIARNDLGQYEEAIADYDTAILLKSNNAEAYSNRGVTKSNLGRYVDAIADYDKAIRLKSDYAYAYNNRGDAKNDLGQYEAAITDCDEAIRLKPHLAEAYSTRSNAKNGLGQHEEAIADCDEAIRLKPSLAEAYYNRGKANISLKRADEAYRDFEIAITFARDAGDESLADNAECALKKLSNEQDP